MGSKVLVEEEHQQGAHGGDQGQEAEPVAPGGVHAVIGLLFLFFFAGAFAFPLEPIHKLSES